VFQLLPLYGGTRRHADFITVNSVIPKDIHHMAGDILTAFDWPPVAKVPSYSKLQSMRRTFQ
jgi:ribosomal protein L10